MNQILQTKKKSKMNKISKFKLILKMQLFLSISLIILIGIASFYTKFKLNQKEKYSNQILDNYNISKLYSSMPVSNSDKNANNIIGIIEIPKLEIYYPIFSSYNDELLKVSPCRFYGPLPGKKGNLCIAGHNYDNNKFFSKINTLTIGDSIVILNNDNKKLAYNVFDIYEVDSTDLSPVYSYNKNTKQLTLITCNNINKKRIIVKAILNI